MMTLTLRVSQKYAMHPPNKSTPFTCHNSLSKVFFAKKKYGLYKTIHAKKHEKEKER
jgi:hypothetical protein